MNANVGIAREIREKCGIKSVHRAKRLILKALDKFKLNLKGLTVLTEAASGNYIFTPIIAALAGAEKVHAVTRDSRYASAEQVIRNTLLLANYCGISDRLEIRISLSPEIIGQADIVTNLGFVRPINKEFISHMKETAVIPLMYETWEYREEDLDLAECWGRGIPVLGTNEGTEELETFGYIGYLAMKLAFELDIEVFKSKVVVVGGGYFGKSTVNAFTNAGAKVVNFRITEGDILHSEKAKDELSNCDLLVFVEHELRDLILGEGGQLTVSELLSINPGISIVHIAGGVDKEAIQKAQIPCRPVHLASSGYMSVTTGYLGPKPIIDLHTAGLKVGEVLARARLKKLSVTGSEKAALNDAPAQCFNDEQKKRYGQYRLTALGHNAPKK